MRPKFFLRPRRTQDLEAVGSSATRASPSTSSTPPRSRRLTMWTSGIYEKCSDPGSCIVGLFLFGEAVFSGGGSDCKAVCPLLGFKIGERTARRQLPVVFFDKPHSGLYAAVGIYAKKVELQGGRLGSGRGGSAELQGGVLSPSEGSRFQFSGWRGDCVSESTRTSLGGAWVGPQGG